MERAAVEELFTFTDYSWREYEKVIRPLGDDLLTRAAPGSGWPALRDCLAHIVFGYVRWLASPVGTTDEPTERVTSWEELEVSWRLIREPARVYLDSLDDHELVKPREMDVDGEPMLYRPADIFAHAMLHDRQHHGDLNTLLYQLGIEVPIVESSVPGQSTPQLTPRRHCRRRASSA